jgi:hypothetical protein
MGAYPYVPFGTHTVCQIRYFYFIGGECGSSVWYRDLMG